MAGTRGRAGPAPGQARVWALALLLTLVACNGDAAFVLRSWRFEREAAAPEPITLPVHLDGRLGATRSTYHLRTEIELPATLVGRDLVLALPRLWAPVTLLVDGVVQTPLEWTPSPSYRPSPAKAWRIPADRTTEGRLALDLAVDHTWTQSGWVDTPPYLTTEPDGGPWLRLLQTLGRYAGAVGASVFTTIAFTYAVIFLLDRRRRAQGWFAAQGFMGASYCLFTWGPLEAIFGRYDTAALAIALTIAIYVSVQFTHTQFSLPRPHRLWDALVPTMLLVAVFAAGPYSATYWMGRPLVVILLSGVAYQLWVLGRLSRETPAPPNARIFFACWASLGAATAGDCAGWFGLGESLGGLRTADIGLTLFAFLQSIALSGDFSRSVVRADQLNQELRTQVDHLAEHKRVVEGLNEELRRQVLARSEELADALTRLASAPGITAALQEGDVVEDRYAIVRALGAGGMGMVYQVRRTTDDACFALKVLLRAAEVEGLARFAREAQMAAHINHPNVVRIVDAAIAKQGFLYLVLEYVDGQPLQRLRARFGDVSWALTVLEGIARGLAAIHAQGIVHRDLKPPNVLVQQDAEGMPVQVKIADFGISHVLANGNSEERASLTRTGLFLGTPAYTAPEIFADFKRSSPASDVYSFGVIAFELLFCRRPGGDDGPSLIPSAGPAPSFEEGDILSPDLARVLDGTLAPRAEGRPTAEALVEAIAAARRRIKATATAGPGGRRPLSSVPDTRVTPRTEPLILETLDTAPTGAMTKRIGP